MRNVNRSDVTCPVRPDGKTYTVRGHLTGPTGSLQPGSTAATASLYLHGLSFGEFFWRFQGTGGYNYSQAAALDGQVSVTIDRLGYGESDKPAGNAICLGSQADVANQIVGELKHGSYSVGNGGSPKSFAKVALVGHSYGGQIAEVAAYSFHQVDGLVVVGFSDKVQSRLLKDNSVYAAKVCAAGGTPPYGVGRSDYASLGSPAGAPKALFSATDTNPQVLAHAQPLLSVDPCGDLASVAPGFPQDLAHVGAVDVPVLVVTGGSDKLFPPPAGASQAALFTGSPSVTQTTIAGSGHAYTLEHTHAALEHDIDSWLDAHVLSRS